jgi:NAD(P)H dehydrogenase (quinone)
MTAHVYIVFYSMFGTIYKMAEAVLQRAREVAGAEVKLCQVPELLAPRYLLLDSALLAPRVISSP